MDRQIARGDRAPAARARLTMFYREWPPAPELAPIVKCLWALEKDYRGPFPDHEHLWADANGELIFTFGAPYWLGAPGRKRVLESPFTIGPFTRSFDLYSGGLTTLVGARLFPWGFFALSQRPVPDLVDRVLPAADVFGADVARLVPRLAGQSHEERIATLTAWLVARMRELSQSPTVRSIALRIMETKGALPIARLAREFGITPRRIERRFRAETGLSAKQLSRIVRFNHAKQLIQSDPAISLGELTHAAGYSDQAHFSKSFKEMFGITPKTFKEQMVEALALFAETRPSVAFLQDE